MNRPSASSSKPVFLATTALEGFWDTSSPILFLSEGCRRYSRRSVWENLDGRVLESPWRSAQEVHDAYQFSINVQDKLLPLLSQALNAAHGRRHGLRYWRIFLGPWLDRYTHVLYDRYRLIRRALDLEPNLTTIGLADSDFVTPHDADDFQSRLQDDPYNLQLYTKILMVLGANFPRKNINNNSAPTTHAPLLRANKRRTPKDCLKRWVRNLCQIALETAQRGRPLILKAPGFPLTTQALIMLATSGRAWINQTPPFPRGPATSPINVKLRSRLRSLPIETEFDRVLSALLPGEMPRCFVEEYERLESYARAHYPMSPRAIFSANAWYWDEAFQHWAGSCAEDGTYLIGTQHGGYGTQRYMLSVAHELAICDRFYTWGWERNGITSEIVILPATKLAGRSPLPADNGRDGILYVLATAQRYLLEFPYSPEQHHDYLARQKIFVQSLDPRARSQLRARPHFADYGWDLAQRWRDDFPDIALELWNRPFQESLAACRLFVADHIYTTYLEALAIGKPTILFLNLESSINEFHPDAQDYFDELRSVGVLHNTPESAAKAVGDVYGDVETWWNEPRRQAAIERFRRRFARTSSDALALWTEEFTRIADISRKDSSSSPRGRTTGFR